MILVLGGTAEARELAATIHGDGVSVTSSLAGRVSNPRLPNGEVRIGGFGGPQGLADWLHDHDVTAVVDATHPFAERISASAVQACAVAGVPLLRLERPGWQQRPGDHWTWVDDLESAAAAIPDLGTRAFLTTGRQGLTAFAPVKGVWFLIRCVEAPEPPLPASSELLLDRGPYTLVSEGRLMDRHRIDLLVTKDSGGDHTVAKLDAARHREMPVIIVRRPSRPNLDSVRDVSAALRWVLAQVHAG